VLSRNSSWRGFLERLPWRAIGRWWAVGLSFFFVGLGMLYLCMDVLRMPLLIGTLLVAEVTTIVRYAINDRWVFGERRPSWTRLWQFHLANAGGFAIWWTATNILARTGVCKSALRRALSQAYTFLVNAFSGYNILYHNGMAVTLRYNVMRWGPYSFGFGFQAELITRLLDEGASIMEIPVAPTHRQKAGGNSAVNWCNFLSVGHTLLEILIRRVRKHAFRK